MEIGTLVSSLKGRDVATIYIIYKKLDENFVLVVNGHNKLFTNPKKKRIKHLKNLGVIHTIIQEKLLNDKKVFDAEVYSAIKKFKQE